MKSIPAKRCLVPAIVTAFSIAIIVHFFHLQSVKSSLQAKQIIEESIPGVSSTFISLQTEAPHPNCTEKSSPPAVIERVVEIEKLVERIVHVPRPPPPVECKEFGDLSAYCIYRKSLCFRGTSLYVIDDAKSGEVPNLGGLADNLLHNFRDILVSSDLPYRSFLSASYARSSDFADVPVLDGMTAVAGFDATNYNIFHFATKALSYFSFRMRESTIISDPKKFLEMLNVNKSPFKRSVFFRNSDLTDWQKEFAKISLGEDVEPFYLDNFGGLGSAGCFHEAVIGGANLNLLQGSADSSYLRSIISSKYGIAFERRDVVFFRRDRSRLVLNDQEFIAALERVFQMPIKVVSFWEQSFREQLEVISKAAVLISTHGSNSNHALYMPQGGVVIEIVGRKMNYILAERISLALGVYHFRYMALDDEMDTSDERKASFAALSTAQCFGSPECFGYARDTNIRVNIARIEPTLVAARDIVKSG